MRHVIKYIISCFCLASVCFTGTAQRVKHIKITGENISLYRDSLKLKIFGTTVFPYEILPDSVHTNVDSLLNIAGFPYSSIVYPSGNLDSIDEILVKLDDDLYYFPEKVHAYLFHPHNNNGKLFIYHSGHCIGIAPLEDIAGNAQGQEPGLVIPKLLLEGYTVLAVPMMHYRHLSPAGVVCGYNNHDIFFTDEHYQNPRSFFFRPLISCLNFLGRSSYTDIYMCGLSGGGWTTTLYPALDSSITMSFPVAGSWPLPLRNLYYAGGDYEQTDPQLFNFLDYHEIYTMACLGPARKMLQIHNRYDACCFNGPFAQIFYVDSVAAALQGTGGIFKFYLEELNHGHSISARSLEVMLTFIRNETASLQNLPADSVVNGMNYFYDIKNNFTLNVPGDNSVFKYSLLKAPAWLSLDNDNGQLSGTVPAGDIISLPDSVSFKVEDSTGRFVICNYNIIRKRVLPYIFTMSGDHTTAHLLLPYSGSINQVNPLVITSFYSNNTQLSVVSIAVENNSLIRLRFNQPLEATDSLAYNGFSGPNPLLYTNGLKVDDFNLTPVNLDAVTTKIATAGMIRFNTDTTKFEYFNGMSWIDMN